MTMPHNKQVPKSSLIGRPYNPDDEDFARLLDSQYKAGYTAGWNAAQEK